MTDGSCRRGVPSASSTRSAAPSGAAALVAALCLALAGCSPGAPPSSGPGGRSGISGDSGGVNGSGSSSGGDASCAQPDATVSPDVAAPGDEVTVTATGRFDDCDDTGLGLTPAPAQDVSVVLWQGGPDVPLTVVDAHGPDAAVEVVVAVPEDAPEGEAVIAVGPGQTTPNLTIRR